MKKGTHVFSGPQTSQDSALTTYTFDASGNRQIVQAPSSALTTNTWDYENRMTLVELPTGARVTMTYNANNRRVSKET